MERTSFDNQLFTWEHFRQESPMDMQFSNIQLTVAVGQFPIGAKFPFAFLLGSASLLVLVDDNQQEHGFDLKVAVGEKVDAFVRMPKDSCECGQHHHH